MPDSGFHERRKEYRLPYAEKVIFTDGQRTMTAHAANMSRGGVFAKTLNPFPIDTSGFLAFSLPQQSNALVVRAKVAHLVFDKHRCEVECGMGLQFIELTKTQKSALNLHVLNEQSSYLELRELLKVERPDVNVVSRVLQRLPHLFESDLLGLRYRVSRICTLFEPTETENTGEHPISA